MLRQFVDEIPDDPTPDDRQVFLRRVLATLDPAGGVQPPPLAENPSTSGDREGRAQALEQLGRTVEHVLSETGMTEDEVARWFDLKHPLPE